MDGHIRFIDAFAMEDSRGDEEESRNEIKGAKTKWRVAQDRKEKESEQIGELNRIGIGKEREEAEGIRGVHTVFIDGLSGFVRHVHVSHEHVATCDNHKKRSNEEWEEEAVRNVEVEITKR